MSHPYFAKKMNAPNVNDEMSSQITFYCLDNLDAVDHILNVVQLIHLDHEVGDLE